MTAKVEAESAVESRGATRTTTSSSSTAPKVTMFGAKCGFVIPKNKLSGSLVPVFRGGKSLGASDADSGGESNKQIQRKTKWGPDLTQDASVRKGRALAYQARVDQITQQLKCGMLEAADDEDLSSAPENPHDKSSTRQIDREEVEQLELEKREAIGEILKLNPSYKAPPDYKPLLKESTVLIPVKEYPRYNFLGLIYGPESDNQRQLEKETGAKIQVYGTKAGTGEKVEVKPSIRNELQGEYEQLHVHVSADTFEKVDAAVAVIELLVTSVSGNLAAVPKINASVSGDNTHAPSTGQDATTHNMVPTAVVNGIVQPVGVPTQPPLDGQFQYPSPFFSMGPSSTTMNIPGFSPLKSSRPFFNNPTHLSTSPFQSTNLPTLFGTPPALASPRQHSPTQVFQQTYMAHTSPGNVGPPRNLSVMAPQPSSVQFDTSTPLTYMENRPPPTGSSSIIGPFAPSFPQLSNAPTSLAQPLQSRVASSVSEKVPNFTPLKPPMMVSPNPGDFTFQPHRSQNPSFQLVPQPSSHFSAHNAFPARTMAPPPASQAPFQFPVQNMTQTGMLSRPQVEHLGQPLPAHISAVPFARNSTAIPVPPRLATFLDTSPLAPRPQHLPMGPRNFNPAHHMPHLPSHLPPRPGNHIHYPAHSIHPEIPPGPNSQFSNNLAFASGKLASSPSGRQLYDPFSHTSMSSGTQQQQ